MASATQVPAGERLRHAAGDIGLSHPRHREDGIVHLAGGATPARSARSCGEAVSLLVAGRGGGSGELGAASIALHTREGSHIRWAWSWVCLEGDNKELGAPNIALHICQLRCEVDNRSSWKTGRDSLSGNPHKFLRRGGGMCARFCLASFNVCPHIGWDSQVDRTVHLHLSSESMRAANPQGVLPHQGQWDSKLPIQVQIKSIHVRVDRWAADSGRQRVDPPPPFYPPPVTACGLLQASRRM